MSEFVKGQCPLCGSGVFVGSCGWLTCSGSECPDPLFVGEIFEKYKESNSNLGELMRIVKQLEAMPVPAPRLEWLGDEETGHLAAHGVGNVWQIIGFPFFTDGETFRLSTAAHLARGSVEDLQELAQRLQDVIEFFDLSAPPVGTQEKEN